MSSSRKTTCGILASIGVGAGGAIATAFSSFMANEKCKSAVEGITDFVAQNITIPEMTKIILVTIPNSTLEFFGQSIPIPGFERNATITIPETHIEVADVLGQGNVDTISGLPEVIGETCSSNVLLHGIAYTAIATTLTCTLTALYHLNHKHKQAHRNNHNNVELGLMRHSLDSAHRSRPRHSRDGEGQERPAHLEPIRLKVKSSRSGV